MKLTNRFLTVLAFALLPFIQGCGVYGFTGISIDYSKIKTISISTFFNDSGGGPPNISQTFTETIKDYFQQNSELALVNYDGDLQMEGSITRYSLRPVAPTASSAANVGNNNSLQRLEIVVKVNFVNTKKEKDNYNKTFTFFADYDPSQQSLTAAEPELIDVIFEQIVFDIFNASVANW